MAVCCSRATGNWLTNSTWGLVDSTSFANSETTGATPPTSAGATARSSGFTPGAITIDGIAVKLRNRTGTTGTMTVNLWNNTDSVNVTGTSVTINMADLQPAVTADLDGGWILFAFASVLLVAGKSYMVQVVTSNATQVNLFTDAGNNWSRFLRTTTQQAPAAGDDAIVVGEYTGAGTDNDFTVTMNETANTDYGASTTSLVTPALAIGAHGTLEFNAASAGNPYLRLSGHLVVYNGGAFNIGTTGTPIPRNSVAVLEFDCAADGDRGMVMRPGSATSMQGLSRSSGKDVWYCLLNTDEAVNSTSLGVDTDTGWLDNDEIAIASTTRTVADCETAALNGNAGGSSLTIDGAGGAGGGLAAAHSGTSPTQAAVILLTRNVRVRSVTSTIMTYVRVQGGTAAATVDVDWVEFRYLGENATAKRGFDIQSANATIDIQYCSFRDCEDGAIYCGSATWDNVTVSNIGFYNCPSSGGSCVQTEATSGTNYTFSNLIGIRTAAASNGFLFQDVGGTFDNLRFVASGSCGVQFSENGAILGSVSNLDVSCAQGSTFGAISFVNCVGIASDCKAWRNAGPRGLEATGAADIIIDGAELFGNAGTNFSASTISTAGARLTMIDVVSNGDTSFSTASGFGVSSGAETIIINGDFSTVSGIKTAHTQDIGLSNTVQQPFRITLINTKLGASTEIANLGGIGPNAFIASQKHDQASGNHKTWMRGGIVQTDATIYNTAAPSMRMTPSPTITDVKLESAPWGRGIQVAVESGQTVDISAYVRKSVSGDGAAYNGNEPRLILRRNDALGISADTVIDTAAGAAGSWEQLSGTSPAANDDGVFEFVIDCDGTAGWVNVDDLAAA